MSREYDALLRIAQRRLAEIRMRDPLAPSELLHEAYLRLAGHDSSGWSNRTHFVAAVATAMHQVLIDRFRHRAALKRGGRNRHVALPARLPDSAAPAFASESDLGHLRQAVERLREAHPRCAEVVLLRFFAGMNREYAAATLNISLRTCDREWDRARAWLETAVTRCVRDSRPAVSGT